MVTLISDAVVMAVIEVVLRGRPTGEGRRVAVRTGATIPAWPFTIYIGNNLLYLKRIDEKPGGYQEALYRFP